MKTGHDTNLPLNHPSFFISVLLFVVVVTAFSPALLNGFVNYDDNLYVLENPYVHRGISCDGVFWAFGRLHGEGTYWHPLTWISHMLDFQVYGLEPWGHHLSSVLLHAANTLLVFHVFRLVTGAFWRSAFLAALFGLHPLQVDSVAWLTERKTLLSAFFWLLTMWAYWGYARTLSRDRAGVGVAGIRRRSIAGFYCLALVLFSFGLMCKPVLVTLPFVLLLLDYWPLQRGVQTPSNHNANWVGLILEKVPFFTLALVSCLLTINAHRAMGMLDSISAPPVSLRLANAGIAYIRYLAKTLWPIDLAVLYPYPRGWPLWQAVLSVALLVSVSVLSLRFARRSPWALFGWCWFLGILVPFIGFIQAGEQSMADRFMYLPLLGLFMLMIWAVHSAVVCRPVVCGLVASCVGVVLAVYAAQVRCQIGSWRDDLTLWRHALAATRDNATAHYGLGTELAARGLLDQGIGHLREALVLRPRYAAAHYNLGAALRRKGLADEAMPHLQQAVAGQPDDPKGRIELGLLLADQGMTAQAVEQYKAALALRPSSSEAHYNLGVALRKLGQYAESAQEFREVLRLDKRDPEANRNLDQVLVAERTLGKEAEVFRQALRLNPQDAQPHLRLGQLLLDAGCRDAAVEQWRDASLLAPRWAEPLNNLAWVLATDPQPARRDGLEAVRLATRAVELAGTNNAGILDTMAAAYAEAGRFAEAVATAQQAEISAVAAGQKELAGQIQRRLALYRANQSYQDSTGVK
jgi:protein O-mannosyl-transferase